MVIGWWGCSCVRPRHLCAATQVSCCPAASATVVGTNTLAPQPAMWHPQAAAASPPSTHLRLVHRLVADEAQLVQHAPHERALPSINMTQHHEVQAGLAATRLLGGGCRCARCRQVCVRAVLAERPPPLRLLRLLRWLHTRLTDRKALHASGSCICCPLLHPLLARLLLLRLLCLLLRLDRLISLGSSCGALLLLRCLHYVVRRRFVKSEPLHLAACCRRGRLGHQRVRLLLDGSCLREFLGCKWAQMRR